jgi:hypothetical protein
MKTYTAAALRRMSPDELRAELGQLADLDLLKLADELVLALPDEVLEWRRDRLLSSRKGVSAKQAAQALGVSDKHFQRLRKNYLDTGEEGFDAVPAPDDDLSDDDVRRPGDGKTIRGGAARWTLDVLVRWLIERERTDPERRGALTLILRPGGRKPPGRTPSRVPEQRTELVPAA